MISRSAGEREALGRSVEFLRTQFFELQRLYAGEYVALAGEQVAAKHTDPLELQKLLDVTHPNDTVLIEYVPFPGEVVDWK